MLGRLVRPNFSVFLSQQSQDALPLNLVGRAFEQLSESPDILVVNEALHGRGLPLQAKAALSKLRSFYGRVELIRSLTLRRNAALGAASAGACSDADLDKPRRRVARPPPGAASIGESSLPLVGGRCRQIRNVGPGQPRYFRDLGSIEIGHGDDDHPFCACGHFEEYLECNPLRGGRIDAKLIRSVAKAIWPENDRGTCRPLRCSTEQPCSGLSLGLSALRADRARMPHRCDQPRNRRRVRSLSTAQHPSAGSAALPFLGTAPLADGSILLVPRHRPLSFFSQVGGICRLSRRERNYID